jgi:peptidoglycan/xylan/chitin deacetylase (PgdA/CDA1 family)
MWRRTLKVGGASVLAATGLNRVVARASGQAGRPLVLGYHRVVPEYRPDPSLTLDPMQISVAMLEAQLDWVARRYRVVSLDDLATYRADGSTQRLAAVTIDDGYRDAYEIAFPLLRRKGIPATFFLVTDLVGDSRAPIFDRLYYQLARGFTEHGGLPPVVSAWLSRQTETPRAAERIRTARSAYEALQALLDRFSHRELHPLLEEAESLHPMPAALKEALRCVDWDEVARMADHGMTIGSHTRTHVFLNREDPQVVTQELHCSRQRLEQQIGRPVRHLAYPAGQWNGAAVRAVASTGYAFAYTCCRHRDRAYPHLTIPRRILWESSCADAAGRFSATLMEAQTSGAFDLIAPPCHLNHVQ